PGGRPDAHAPADGEPAGRVQERLLADPAPVADAQRVAVVALEYGVVADIHVVADRHVLRMEDQGAGLEHHAAPARGERARVDRAGAVGSRHGARVSRAMDGRGPRRRRPRDASSGATRDDMLAPMASIRIVDSWIRSPASQPTHHRSIMVVADAWA